MFLISGITLDLYIFKLLFFILGCVIVALGVYLELLGDVAMLSGDAFIKVIAQVAHRQYGNIKIINDISMTAISAVLCLIFLNALVGVREGTVIAAFIVGPIIRICQKVFKPLGEKLLLDENK